MRFYRSYLIIAILTLFYSCKTKSGLPRSYDYTPVLLHLDAGKQADSLGFNLTNALPELLYPRILTGDLPIWESADKKSIKGPNKLIALEKIATRPFVRSSNLFIHQYWQIYKRNFEFGIRGFSFTGETKSGSPINYGYIDGPDVITLLKSEYIPMTVNGSCDITYWEALHTMAYNFNLVQFGNNNFRRDARVSAELQYQAIYDPKIYRDFEVLPKQKRIKYQILNPEISSNKENSSVYRKLQYYVNENKQTILNATKSAYFAENIYKPWTIEKITIEEVWEKTTHLPLQQFKNIELFIDNKSITLSAKQLEEMDIKINLQGIAEYLSEKRFSFLLEQVNEEEIQPDKSELIYESLLTNDWNKIN